MEMLVDPSDQQHRLHTAKPQIPADPIFSRSRPAQIAAAPGLSLPVLTASGALYCIRWLNRNPYEGRRRKGTLKAAAGGARQQVRVSAGRVAVAGRPQRHRPPERPSSPGASASEGAPRSGQRDTERPRRQTKADGEREAAAERPSPRDCRAQANLGKGDSARGWAV